MLEAAEDNKESDLPTYIAARLVQDKHLQLGVPSEAKELAATSDVALHIAEFGLGMHFILDRRADSERQHAWSQARLIALGRECLKYCGTMNGSKLPVAISLYELGSGAATDGDRRRLEALQRSAPGLKKVVINCYYLDTQNKTVWTGSALQRWFPGLGHRSWLERLLRAPQILASAAPAVEARIPAAGRPWMTMSLLVLLALVFAVEHWARIGGDADGLLGVDIQTLFALGGMNRASVLEDSQWYRLLSAALLHADLFHIVFNSVALGLAGYLLERLLGSAWLLVLFVVGALGGSLMGLLLNPADLISIGASGAAMALLAAALVTSARYPRGAMRTQMQLRLVQFLVPSLLPLATHRPGSQIDFAAHFGGAIAGGLAGFALLKLWPSQEERPRFSGAVRGLAALAGATIAGSLVIVQQGYGAYAEEFSFSVQDLLVPDGQIPEDPRVAHHDVDVWGKDHPRDPRVHLFRALNLAETNQLDLAEAELRAALTEPKIFERAFANGHLETTIRAVLSKLLLGQGRDDEAKLVAAPVCRSDDGSVPEVLRELGICD